MTEPEQPLVGGAISGPVRVGDTVRRPRASAAVHSANAAWVAQWTP